MVGLKSPSEPAGPPTNIFASPKDRPARSCLGAEARSEAYHTAFARLVSNWVAMIGLDVSLFGTHSLRSENEHAGLAVARLGVLHEPIHSPWGLLASPIYVRAIERSEHRHL